MQKIAQGLKALEVEIDLIITSPYVRAVGTTKILQKVFDLKKEDVVATEHLAPVGYSDQLIHLINEKYADVEKIALVGHEPSLSSLVSVLLTGEPNLALTLKKGGVCRLTVDNLQYGHCAILNWLLYPSQLAGLVQ